MAHPRPRGIIRRTGAVLTAAAVVSVGAVTAPAQAAEKSVFSFVAPDTQTLLPQSSGGTAADFRTLTSFVVNEGPADAVTGVRIAVDASRLAGIAELSLPQGCSFTPDDPSHLHAVCTVGPVALLGTSEIGIRSVAGAAEGAKGRISYKVTAANATEDPEDAKEGSTSTDVVIGHGPDLAAADLGGIEAKPGTSAEVTPQVTNQGDRAAQGLVLLLDAGSVNGGSAYALAGSYSNCLYHYGDPDQEPADRTAVLCSFPDVTLQPGDTYRVSSPAELKVGDKATKGFVEYGFDVTGGELAGSDPDATGTKGTGSALSLVPVTKSAARAHVADIDYTNNIGFSLVSTGQVADVAVTAGDVRGTVGLSSAFRATVTNTGTLPTEPLEGAPTADTTGFALVLFPLGVTVTSAPRACFAQPGAGSLTSLDRGPAATRNARNRLYAKLAKAESDLPEEGTVYACLIERVLDPGQSASFSFTLRPTKVLHRAEGMVLAGAGFGEADGLDDNPADNLVEFRVSAAGAQGASAPSATASASATATAPASAASTGGGLATTGGGSDAGPIALAGAAAVLLGAGAVLLARRRGSAHR